LEALRRIKYRKKDFILQYILPDTRALCRMVLNEEHAEALQGAQAILNWLDREHERLCSDSVSS